MKNLNIILYIFLLNAILNSCENLLEVDLPNNQLTSAVVYNSDETAQAALLNIYGNLRDNGLFSGQMKGGTIVLGLYADELNNVSTDFDLQQVNSLTHNSRNTSFSYLWSKSYEQLYMINFFIENIQLSQTISTKNKEQFLGEAYTLRALIYLNLNQLFNEIPYVKSSDYKVNKLIKKNNQSQINDFIESDLKLGESYFDKLPVLKDKSRINRYSNYMVFSKYYLLNKQWDKALHYSNMIINSGDFKINLNLDSEFNVGSSSCIWSLDASTINGNTFIAQVFIPSSYPSTTVILNNEFVNEFENNDFRKLLWINTVTNGTITQYYPYKYKQRSTSTNRIESLIIFRLSEAFLIRSEAYFNLNRIEESLNDLNLIRTRAGLAPIKNDEDIYSSILKERKFELFTEFGNRLLDLKRTDKLGLLQNIKPNYKKHHALFPIPENEILLNPNLNPQNDGY